MHRFFVFSSTLSRRFVFPSFVTFFFNVFLSSFARRGFFFACSSLHRCCPGGWGVCAACFFGGRLCVSWWLSYSNLPFFCFLLPSSSSSCYTIPVCQLLVLLLRFRLVLVNLFASDHTIWTSWITPHHFIFRELISVVITPPITPNYFWGFNKRNSQEKLHLLVLSLLGRSTPPITPNILR